MSDHSNFKKHFISTVADRLVNEKNKSAKEAQEMAENRYKMLVDDEDEFTKKFDEWSAKQSKDGDKGKGAKRKSPKEADDDDEPAAPSDKKKAAKPKKPKAPVTDAEGSEDGEPKPPKAKRAKRVNPDDIEPPKKRVQFHTSIHFDKNGHMYFYNRKTNESTWHLPMHDFGILFGDAIKEMGLSAGGGKAKRGNRKSRLHGYHIFVKEFKTDVTIDNPHEKGKERIRLAAAAWKKLTEDEKVPWHNKAVKTNEESAAKEKGDGAEAAAAGKDESKAAASKGKKGSKAVAVKADAGNDDWEAW